MRMRQPSTEGLAFATSPGAAVFVALYAFAVHDSTIHTTCQSESAEFSKPNTRLATVASATVLAADLVECENGSNPMTTAPMPNFAGFVTNQAVKSGNASDPSVWSKPMTDGDWLGIPAGIAIDWDLTACPRLAGIYVAGVLDAGLRPGALVINVGTIFVAMSGGILAGDCMNEVPLTADTLTVTFLNLPLDPVRDPGQFSNGLLTMGGTLNMCGSAYKTPWTTTSACHKGDTTLTLDSAPIDWDPGDRLLIPGVLLSPVQDEVAVIQSVAGNVVTLATPLVFDHLPVPQPKGQPNFLPIGNLTRRITFKSENPSGVRGHCMFMRDGAMPSMVNVCHVALKDLGRTLATKPVTDPQVDASGVLVPGTDANVRARYSWHSHRQGQDASALQTWDGLVVEGFQKWGFVNHDSYVNATNLVAYNGQGAGLSTERGTEIGTFDSCLSVRTTGVTGQAGFNFELSRLASADLGWQGHGIWCQGPGVTLTNNVCSGHPDAGIHVMTMGPRPPLPSDNTGTLAYTFPRALLPSSYKLLNPNVDPLVVQVPLFGVSNNTAFGCGVGHFVDWNQTDSPNSFKDKLYSKLLDTVAWNCGTGLLSGHMGRLQDDDSVLSGNFATGSIGRSANGGYDFDIITNNPSIAGFETGASHGLGHIYNGGYYSNVNDFSLFFFPYVQNRTIFQLRGTAEGSPTDPVFVSNAKSQFNFKCSPFQRVFFGTAAGANVNGWFTPINFVLPNGLQVYCQEQGAAYVPAPTTDPLASQYPPQILGLTNEQLRQQFNVSLGDKIPGIASGTYTTNGIISTTQPDRPWYVFGGGAPTSAWQTTNPSYQLSVWNYADSTGYKDPAPVTLVGGWNPLSRTINGQAYTYFVNLPGNAPPPPPSPKPTTTTVKVTQQPGSVQVSATVSSTAPVNDGTVTFIVQVNGVTVGTVQVPVANGAAAASIAETLTVQANYSGSGNFGASKSQ